MKGAVVYPRAPCPSPFIPLLSPFQDMPARTAKMEILASSPSKELVRLGKGCLLSVSFCVSIPYRAESPVKA